MEQIVAFFQLPFGVVLPLVILVLVSSTFVKVALIFSLFFFGMGLSGSGGKLVALALALVCTFHLNGPDIELALERAQFTNAKDQVSISESTARFSETWKAILKSRLTPEDLKSTSKITRGVESDSWKAILPTTVLKDLKSAFSAGFKILLPFLAIDLLVAYLFTALDIRSLHAYTLALPLKILAFISVDGLTLLTTNLLSSYQG